MIQKYLIVLIGWSFVLLVPAYKYHKMYVNNIHNQYAQEMAEMNQEARDKENELQTKVDTAYKEARKREDNLKRDISNARNELNKLRKYSTETADNLSKATRETCNNYGVLATELLTSCSGKYQELAETTDRCISDLRLIYEGWPTIQTNP